MKEKIAELSNQELLAIYRLLLEHQEYLENEKKKMEEAENEKWITRALWRV